MLSDEGFLVWCRRVGLSREAQELIAKIRSSPPTRRVGGGRENVAGRYPSRKMGVTIQFESHRVELAFVYEMEHDSDVLEYYDQAPSIRLDYQSAHERHLAVVHTPDYFVIHTGSAGWQECKHARELERLAQKSPIATAGTEMGSGDVRQEKRMPLVSDCITASGHRQRSIGRCNGISSTWKITGVSMPAVLRPKSVRSSHAKFERRPGSS